MTDALDHLLHENRKFSSGAEFSTAAKIPHREAYEKLYLASKGNPDAFWLSQAETLDWIQKPKVACKYRWDAPNRIVEHTWFEDGVINVSYNCLDRHLKERGKKQALLWQGDRPEEKRALTYEELYHEVCRFAAVLKSRGIKKGDRIAIYMPNVPEALIAVLASARIGAIHSVVFGGFSADSLAHRIEDCKAKILVTANAVHRGGKTIALKEIADVALAATSSIESVIVYQRNESPCPMREGRDHFWHDEMGRMQPDFSFEAMKAEDPLFILYTSGSTGKPKGVVHTQAGYLLWAQLTHSILFDVKEDDIWFCTADLGWITGHSYGLYGPLANGTTTVVFEGTPTWPDAGRLWEIVQDFKVTLFYTAPTVIRALIRHGTEPVLRHDLSTLRLLATVGEPINPEAWMWYYEVIGKGKCPVVDTWWQTETGGVMIAPFPAAFSMKPGSAGRPFFGVEPDVIKEGQDATGGSLVIKKPWPGIMRTMWKDHERFIDTYFSLYGCYFTGDGARVDSDGDFWLLGRIDDVVNVSGHRIGTAEVESALVSHEAVAEAAVVPMPHEIKGQGLFAYVTLVDEVEGTEGLVQELREHVRREIGPIAVPDRIRITEALPKTRSGKIMRRILRKIVEKDFSNLGDISTLADPKVVEDLMVDE